MSEIPINYLIAYGSPKVSVGCLIMLAVVLFLYRRKSRPWLLFASFIPLLLGIGSIIFNMRVNMSLFPERDADRAREAADMIQSMTTRGLRGKDASILLPVYGCPQLVEQKNGCECWIYAPGPWYSYLRRLHTVVVVVRDGRVESWSVRLFD